MSLIIESKQHPTYKWRLSHIKNALTLFPNQSFSLDLSKFGWQASQINYGHADLEGRLHNLDRLVRQRDKRSTQDLVPTDDFFESAPQGVCIHTANQFDLLLELICDAGGI